MRVVGERAKVPGGGPAAPICWAIIALAGVIAFGNGFAAPFVFDGDPLAEGLAAGRLFPYTLGGVNRGVVLLTFQANYLLDGTGVWGYHAVNLAIHIAAALALFGIVRRSLLRPSLAARYGSAADVLALAAALVWLVHPLETQSVTYLVQRFESLMGLCFLLVLYGFVRAADSPRPRRWLAAAVASCLIGGLCKETIVVAPLVVLWYDRALVATSWRDIWHERKGFYALLFAAGMVPVLGVMLNPAGYTKSGFLSGAAVTRWEYLRSQPGVVLHYLRLAVWPDALCLDYGWPVATSAGAIAWPLLALAALAGLTLWSIRRCPPVGLLAGWFFLCLAPTSSLVPIVDLAFEHRMYLPLAALAVAAVLLVYEGLELLSRRRRAGPALGRWSFAALIGILVCLLGARTIVRNRDYRDHLAIWQATADRAPANWRARQEYGKVLCQQGMALQAIDELQTADRLKPDSAEILTSLGTAQFVAQRDEEAVDSFRRALAIEPDIALTRVNLAMALERLGRTGDAAEQYVAALALDPASAKAHFQYARLLSAGRKDPQATLREFGATLALDPGHVDAYKGAAATLFDCGRYDDAAQCLERARALAPQDAGICNLLGLCWARLGRWDGATLCFRAALAIDPGFAAASRNLALAVQSAQGRTSDASGAPAGETLPE